MNATLYERILTAISQALSKSLNEEAGTIYNEKWEKFLTYFQDYCQDMYHNKKKTEFTISKEVFDKYGIEFPGKIGGNTLTIKIENDSDDGYATMVKFGSTLILNSKTIDYKRFKEIIIHEFTHGFNDRNNTMDKVLLKIMSGKNKSNCITDYISQIDTEFVKDLRCFNYLYLETEQNARISALGNAVQKIIDYNPQLANNNGVDRLVLDTQKVTFVNLMQKMYNNLKDGKFGNYEKYKYAEYVAKKYNNNAFDDMVSSIKMSFNDKSLEQQLGEIGDIVYLIMHAKSKGQYFMFFKLPNNVKTIKSEEDYNKVHNSIVQQTGKQLENFKKRMYKVICCEIQKFNENNKNQ